MTAVHMLVGVPPALWGAGLVVVGLVFVNPTLITVGLALTASFGVQSVALNAALPSQTRRLLFVLAFVMSLIPLNEAFAHLRIADDAGEARRAQMGVMVFTTLAAASGLLSVAAMRRNRRAGVTTV